MHLPGLHREKRAAVFEEPNAQLLRWQRLKCQGIEKVMREKFADYVAMNADRRRPAAAIAGSSII
jgi:hypothetical protein